MVSLFGYGTLERDVSNMYATTRSLKYWRHADLWQPIEEDQSLTLAAHFHSVQPDTLLQ